MASLSGSEERDNLVGVLDDPGAAVAAIRSKGDLVEFVRSLRFDLLNAPQEWENDTLESYLEAISAWLADVDDVGVDVSGLRLVARILAVGVIYE